MSNDDHELPDGEWIVVFYHQTCTVRLYPTLAAARQGLAIHTFATNVFKSPVEFQRRYDHFQLEAFWREICKWSDWRWPRLAKGPRLEPKDYEVPDLGTEAFAKELWALMQRTGDRIVRLSSSQTRSKDHYELNLTKMRDRVASEDFKKQYPKQCRIIIERMSRYESPYQLESELERMMKNLVNTAQLKTKQDAWLIFQYYRVQLIKDGLVSRGGEGAEDQEEYDEAA